MDRAEPLLREAVRIFTTRLEPRHPWTTGAKAKLGYCLALQHQDERAKQLLTESYALLQDVHPDSTSMNLPRARANAELGLGLYHLRQRHFPQVESLLTRGHSTFKQFHGPERLTTQRALYYLGRALRAMGQA